MAELNKIKEDELANYLRALGYKFELGSMALFDPEEDLSQLSRDGTTHVRRRVVGYNRDGSPKFAVTLIHDGQILLDDAQRKSFLSLLAPKTGDLNNTLPEFLDPRDETLLFDRKLLFESKQEGDPWLKEYRARTRKDGQIVTRTTTDEKVWDGEKYVDKEEWDASQVEASEGETTETDQVETDQVETDQVETDQVDVNQQLEQQQSENWVTQEDINQWAESLKTNFGDTTTTNNEQPITPNESLYANRRLTIEDKNRIRFGDAHVDDLKKRNQDFQDMKRGLMTREEFIQTHPNSQTALKARGM